ncbi:MAG: biopolymer transporter ExbD [Planctomycetia bacterium]|nr:biopolymer transporter ExbD [Planctomycetia bacterium]
MKKKHKQDGPQDVQLNVVITPMLDMTFQLLFFFVLTYSPSSAMEGKMDFNLPASGDYRARAPEDVNLDKPSDTDLALPAQLTVLIKTVRDGVNDGNISALVVKTTDGETALPNLESLENFLRQKIKDEGVSNKDDIKIEAESRLKYACVIDVMDACLKSGFTRVGFNPPPDLTMN